MPAYWRIVQRRWRYIVGYTPRVNGYSPGSPRSRAGSKPALRQIVGGVHGLQLDAGIGAALVV